MPENICVTHTMLKKIRLEMVSLTSYVKYLNTNLIWKGHWICCFTKKLGSLKLCCKMWIAQQTNAKYLLITYFLEGREALHAYLLPYIFIYSFPPAVNNLKQVFQLAMVVYISAFQRFLKSSHFDTYSPTI